MLTEQCQKNHPRPHPEAEQAAARPQVEQIQRVRRQRNQQPGDKRRPQRPRHDNQVSGDKAQRPAAEGFHGPGRDGALRQLPKMPAKAAGAPVPFQIIQQSEAAEAEGYQEIHGGQAVPPALRGGDGGIKKLAAEHKRQPGDGWNAAAQEVGAAQIVALDQPGGAAEAERKSREKQKVLGEGHTHFPAK